MADAVNILQHAESVDQAPIFEPYSRVIIHAGLSSDGETEIVYSAGNDKGRTLEVSCEWGTQAMANNILARINGYQYKPFTAGNALVDPSVELGDGVTVKGIYSGIFVQNTNFNQLMASNISAPVDEEIEHEYGFESKTDRAYTRMVAQTRSGITQNANEIALQVEELRYDILDPNNSESLQSKLTITASAITQEVSDRKQAIQDEADARDEAISASEVTMRSEIQQTAEAITATVSQEVADRQNAIDALHETVTSEISQSADSIRASVVAKKGGTANSFSWDLQSTYFSLKANNQEIFRADKNGISVTGSGSFSGEIKATKGTIGGMTISNNAIYTNGKSGIDTAVNGLHISANGISLGNGQFKVTSNGDLYANSGYFLGLVQASSIRSAYTDPDTPAFGYFNGGGLEKYSVNGGYDGQIGYTNHGGLIGGNLEYSTISTDYTSPGINTSLGYANFADDVFNARNTATYVKCQYLVDTSGYHYGPVSLTIDGTSYRFFAWSGGSPD